MEIINRQQARDRSLKRYFTGGACKRGHVAQRLTSNGNCIECTKDAHQTPERKAVLKRYREKPEVKAARTLRRHQRRSVTAARTDAGTPGLLG
jgi:hypothetical protein